MKTGLSTASNLSESILTVSWKCLHITTHAECSESSRSHDSKNVFATISSASSGHGWNQSMVVQAIKDGKERRRFRRASPIGENVRIMCRLAFTRSIK